MKVNVGDIVYVESSVVGFDDEYVDCALPGKQNTARIRKRSVKDVETLKQVGAEYIWRCIQAYVKECKTSNSSEVLASVFGGCCIYSLLEKYSVAEFLALWKTYEESKLSVGDEVECEGKVGVITYMQEDMSSCYVLWSNGVSTTVYTRGLRKTGKKVDMSGILSQLSKDGK